MVQLKCDCRIIRGCFGESANSDDAYENIEILNLTVYLANEGLL